MDAQALLQEFLGSSHGQQAVDALRAQGISATDAQTYIAHATEAAHDQVNAQGGVLGEHAGRNFLTALASGVARGDGLLGSLKDGLEGGFSGRITEVLATKAGIDPSTASGVAAALTPFISGFLKKKLGG